MSEEKRNQTKQEDKQLMQVEEALLRRATGYEDASGKSVPPDVRAAMYWLENRCPERWKKSRKEETEDSAGKQLTEEENLL